MREYILSVSSYANSPHHYLEVQWRDQPGDSWQHSAPLAYFTLQGAQRKRDKLQAHYERQGHKVTIGETT